MIKWVLVCKQNSLFTVPGKVLIILFCAHLISWSFQDGHEKYLLRSCFDDMNLIPDEILWRTKKCLGDAIAERDNLWFETKKVQQFFEAKVSKRCYFFAGLTM